MKNLKKRAMKKRYSEIETIRARYINLSSNDIDISLFDFPNTRQVLEDLEFLLEHIEVNEKNPAYQAGYEDGKDDRDSQEFHDGYDEGYAQCLKDNKKLNLTSG